MNRENFYLFKKKKESYKKSLKLCFSYKKFGMDTNKSFKIGCLRAV